MVITRLLTGMILQALLLGVPWPTNHLICQVEVQG